MFNPNDIRDWETLKRFRKKDLDIQTFRVKQYSTTWKYVLTVNGVPVVICRGQSSLNDCIAYLMNGTGELKDGKVKKILEKARE